MRTFPIQNSRVFKWIPWDLIEPHEKTALLNHAGQTLQRLAERGGLCPLETVAVLEDKPYRERWPYVYNGPDRNPEAEGILTQLVAEYLSRHDNPG